jgi:hypothetical protein
MNPLFQDAGPAQFTTIDAMLAGGGNGGSLALRLLSHKLDMTAALRSHAMCNSAMAQVNDSLPKDFWKAMDDAIISVGFDRLRAVTMIRRAGLRMQLPNPLAVRTLEWQKVSKMQPATVTMTPANATNMDRLDYTTTGLPIPVIIKEFMVDIRDLEAFRVNGIPFDTAHVQESIRLVNEKVEEMLIIGQSSFQNDSYIYYGLLDHPRRNQGTMAGGGWLGSSPDPIGDVQNMMADARAAKYAGPYGLIVPSNYAKVLGDDYNSTYPSPPVRSRLMDLPDLQDIEVTDKMTASTLGLVQLTNNVVDIVDGFEPRIFEWESRGGLLLNFAVVAIQVPRVRSDYADLSGVVHYTAS